MPNANLPLGYDPMSSGALGQILSSAGRNQPDEDLAFAAGLLKPSTNGTSGALGNAFAAQVENRHNKDALIAQYVPLIQQAMMQQFMGSALGDIYGGSSAQQPAGPDSQQQAPGAYGGAPASGAMPQPGATSAASPQPVVGQSPASPQGNSLFDRVMAGSYGQALQADAMTGGRFNFANAWKLANEGIKQDAGAYYKDPRDGAIHYNVKYGDNLGPLGAAPGAVPGVAAIKGAETGATKQAENDNTPTPPTLLDKDGQPLANKYPTVGDLLRAQQGSGAQPASGNITNPGNLRPPGASTGFQTFKTPADGLAALDKQLQLYGTRGLNTVQSIIGKYAPTNENDTASYIKDVATRMGVKPDQQLDLSDPIQRQILSSAIVLHEQGPNKLFAPPQTAQPSGPTIQGPAAAAGQKVTAEKAAEAGQNYQNALNDKVEEEFQLVQRNKQIMPLLDRYNTGGIAPEDRLQIGNAIANSGALQSLLGPQNAKAIGDKLAGGDVAAGKDLENQLASAGILTMLQTLDKEGKPNRAIFQAVQQAQEGLKSGNTTLKDVFELQNRLYGIHYNEQQALTGAIKNGTYDPRTWAGDYSKLRNDQLHQPPLPLPSATPAKFTGFTAVLKGQ